MGSNSKLREAPVPFLSHPGQECALVFPSRLGCSGVPKTEGKELGRLSWVPSTGWMLVGDSSQAETLDTSPSPVRGSAEGQPRLAQIPVASPGSRVRGRPGIPFPSERAAVPFRTAHPPARRTQAPRGAPPGVSFAGIAAELRGRGPGPPPAPPPRRPAPRPLLGLAAALRSVRRSAGSSFGSSSGSRSRSGSQSGSRSEATALRLGLGRRGGRAATPWPAGRAEAGRGGPGGAGQAGPTRCPRSPAEAAAAAASQAPALALPLPCRSPARPPVVSAPPPTPPSPALASLGGGGAAPGPQHRGAAARVTQRWGDVGAGEGRAAPLCAQPARHPHSGRRGRVARRPGNAGGRRSSQTCEEDTQACVGNDTRTQVGSH